MKQRIKEPKAEWFEGEGVLNYKFDNIDNKIELVKYVYEKENHQAEWILGALGILFISSGIFKVGTFFPPLFFILLVIMGIFYLIGAHHKKKALIKLYLEKDRKK